METLDSKSHLMNTTSSIPDFSKHRFLHVLMAIYGLFWVVMAISPFDRSDWLLENVMVFVCLAFVALMYRRFSLSNASFVMITIFLMLHAVGAHHTYEHVPAGEWIRETFGMGRNQYDRVVHLSFGLLITYPISEAIRNSARTGWTAALVLSVFVTFASSSFFEILESLFATIVSPALGQAYLGTQGDIWDAQKDMAIAFIGSVLCAILAFARKRRPLA